MSKRRQSRHAKAVKREEPRSSRAIVRSQKRPLLIVAGVLVSAFGIAVLAFALTVHPRGDFGPAGITRANATSPDSDINKQSNTIKPASLEELLALPEADLAKVDLAVMNLLCAEGLPGAEKLDVMECSAVMDKWAETVRFETERHLYKFRQAPQDYENSEGFFRMLMLNTVLQQDFGVHYNLERMREIDFSNSKDLFIHGMINDDNGGTCASMPVLVTAVARRLGYPVKLTTAKAHVFCRWEATGDRINLEPSGRGLNTYPDEYYKTWPLPASEEEIKANRYLVALTPKEELAMCLENRGHCLSANSFFAEAEAVFAETLSLCPVMGRYRAFLADARNKRQMTANGGWQRVDPARMKKTANPMEHWDAREHTRRRNERNSPQNPIPNPNPYVNVQPEAVSQLGNPQAGMPPQSQQPHMQNQRWQQPQAGPIMP